MTMQVLNGDRKSFGLETFSTDARVDEFAVDEHPVAIEYEKTRTGSILCGPQGTPPSTHLAT